MSTSIKYAYRKGQTWLYRRTFPQDLQPILGSSLKQSLKTGDLREAKARISEVNATYEDLVAKARSACASDVHEQEQPHVILSSDRPRFSIVRVGDEKVSNLAQSYLADKSRVLSPGGFKSHRYSLQLFLSLYGSKEVGELTRRDGQRFLKLIRDLSPDVGKSAKVKGESLEALVALSKGEQRKIAPQTQKRIWSQINQFLDWVVREGHFDLSPFSELAVTAPKDVQSYTVLTDAEVTALLGMDDPILSAILRIALLSGMRSGEVCGLLAEDVVNKGNLGSFYRIRSNALRSLKTKTAERDVPVHDVIQHDVLPYLPKEGPLFPGITVDRVTKQFAKMRVKLGLDRPGLVFHSTRKWFITQCERTGVPEHFTASLVGHQSSRSGNKLTYRLYSAGISNSQKRQIIDQIRLPPTVIQ
jgi:integrase